MENSTYIVFVLGFTIESYGEIIFLPVKICWSDINGKSERWTLGCVDVYLWFEIFKMAATVIVTIHVLK